jgi:hypothetical protein
VALAVIGSVGQGGTRGSAWYSFVALEGWAIGTGAIVCAIGQTGPSRHGGCWTSIAGALIGSLAIFPGWLMVRSAREPCTIQGPNADDRCATNAGLGVLFGYSLAAVGYAAGTSIGSVAGWRLGASQRDPRLVPESVSFQALSVEF